MSKKGRLHMKVRDATLLGFFLGICMSSTSFYLTEQIATITILIGVLTLIIGKMIIKGPIGGLVTGLGLGISFGGLLSTIM